MYNFLELFLIGLSWGISGPCLISCGSILIPFAAGKENFLNTLLDIFYFSLSRMFAYILLGILSAISGNLLQNFVRSEIITYLRTFAGIYIAILGLLIIIGKEPNIKLCALLNKITLQKSIYTMLFLGFVIGVFPCAPLLAILFNIALLAPFPLYGGLYSFSFGLGTTIVPFLIIGPLSSFFSYLPSKIFKQRFTLIFFRSFCGLLLFLVGLRFILVPLPSNTPSTPFSIF